MRVRFVIDRLVLDGLNLTPAQRLAFEEQLHASIAEALQGYATTGQRHPDTLPAPRSTWRERADLKIDGAHNALGAALGATLTRHAWHGAGAITTKGGR
ncbi:hypothetical protein [Azotobacter chroococcum]|uniref:hypothetical protein n=1 Tax=Azotobacter chroococcum TaxID=353 RepID=UPI0010AE0A7C|nr:hypothetical protein [Azotobacter chroococcum]TKD47385.1 hypothetical protein FCG41_00050 [Azotobacter chroococcum]